MFSPPYVAQNQNWPTHRHWLQRRVPACLAGMDADAWIPPLPEGCKTEASMFPVCNMSGRIHQPIAHENHLGFVSEYEDDKWVNKGLLGGTALIRGSRKVVVSNRH